MEVHVAVAEVPKGDRAGAGEGGLHLRHSGEDEFGHGLNRYRDVVLHRRAERALGRRDAVAQGPEGLGLGVVGGDHGIGDQAFLKRCGECGFKRLAQGGAVLRGRDAFDQRVPRMALGQRRAGDRFVGEDALEAMGRHHLEAFKRIAKAAFDLPEQRARLDDPAKPNPCGDAAGCRRQQP